MRRSEYVESDYIATIWYYKFLDPDVYSDMIGCNLVQNMQVFYPSISAQNGQ